MDSSNHGLKPPHFPLGDQIPSGIVSPTSVEPGEDEPACEVGALLLRGADCLAAVLAEGTSEAGLNESRYRVLAALHRGASGECSQADLAERVLQSESNLSTLLERMGGDGLITRTRSQTDRRRSLIRVTPRGLAALARAERTRAATTVRLMRQFSRDEAVLLADRLRQLVSKLERSLEAGSGRPTGPGLPSERVFSGASGAPGLVRLDH